MKKAFAWLSGAFGSSWGRKVPPPTSLPRPRGDEEEEEGGDDAALAAAMHAALATPRGGSEAVDDKTMARGISKMFTAQRV